MTDLKRREILAGAAVVAGSSIARAADAAGSPSRGADSSQEGYAARGRAVVSEMLGEPFLEKLSSIAASGQFGAANAGLALEFAFGAVWARDGLSRQQRSLVTLGILIGSGRFGELKNHVRAGLRNGLGVNELQEVIVQAIPYCGFPAAAEATEATVAVLREQGLLDPGHSSAKDRGIL
jgi:4-carboxymuconolactone decarboxylase